MNQPAPDWTPAAPPAPAPDGAVAAMAAPAQFAPPAPAPLTPPAPLAAPAAPAPIAAPAPMAAPGAMAAPAPMAAPAAPAPVAEAPAPFAPPAPGMPMFEAPASIEAALDVTAPLAMPGQAAAHPTSLAMPQVEEGPALSAMPTFAASFDEAPARLDAAATFEQAPASPSPATHGGPDAIGGVTAAHAADLADRAAAKQVASDESVDPTGQWWSPGTALVLAVAALAWQFISFYARVQLPLVEGAGGELDNIDIVLGAIPLMGNDAVGMGVGTLLGAGSLFVLLYGSRKGLREPALQLAIGGIAAVSMLLMVALPTIAG